MQLLFTPVVVSLCGAVPGLFIPRIIALSDHLQRSCEPQTKRHGQKHLIPEYESSECSITCRDHASNRQKGVAKNMPFQNFSAECKPRNRETAESDKLDSAIETTISSVTRLAADFLPLCSDWHTTFYIDIVRVRFRIFRTPPQSRGIFTSTYPLRFYFKPNLSLYWFLRTLSSQHFKNVCR